MTEILLFNCCASPERAARVHAESCPLVAAARRSRGKVKVSILNAENADLVDDLNERGFPVKRCKCLKSAK